MTQIALYVLAFVRPAMNCVQILSAALALWVTTAAIAEPIQLKLAFFASEQSDTYRFGVKPFVDGVNTEAQGLVHIDVYPNGALGRAVAEQPRLLRDGVADIAWVVPGQTPYRFLDNELLELPGLFRDGREGTLTYTRLVAANALRGYEEFFVIGAYVSDPGIINTRTPIGSLESLKGQRIRTNNQSEAEALQRLGAIPTIIAASSLAEALAKGSVDGAVLSPAGLFQFGTAKFAMNHYLLGIGTAPLLVLMNRKTFDSLPDSAQAIIRKHSGDAAAAFWIKSFSAREQRALETLKTDPERKAVAVLSADQATANQVFQSVISAWAAKSSRNRELLSLAEAELARIRASK